MTQFQAVQLLIVAEFMINPTTTQNVINLFESMESCAGCAATLIASQIEFSWWHLRIEDELTDNSVLDRVATVGA